MADLPGGASGLLVRDCKGKKADRLVTRTGPGVVSLVNELRRHERRVAEELEPWKTHVEERKVIDASPGSWKVHNSIAGNESDRLRASMEPILDQRGADMADIPGGAGSRRATGSTFREHHRLEIRITAHPEVGGIPDSILPFAAAFTVAPAGPFSRKAVSQPRSCKRAPRNLVVQCGAARPRQSQEATANFLVADHTATPWPPELRRSCCLELPADFVMSRHGTGSDVVDPAMYDPQPR
jgi:hypothetical protein